MNRKLINRLGIPYVLGKCYPKTLPSIFDSFSSVVPSSYPEIKKVVEYNFGNEIFCELPPARSQRFGINSLKFRGSILWNSLSDDVKTPQNLAIFKKKSNPGMALIARATSAETIYWYTCFLLIPPTAFYAN